MIKTVFHSVTIEQLFNTLPSFLMFSASIETRNLSLIIPALNNLCTYFNFPLSYAFYFDVDPGAMIFMAFSLCSWLSLNLICVVSFLAVLFWSSQKTTFPSGVVQVVL